MRKANGPQAQGVFWLAVTVLLLFTAPRLGVKLGPLPIYAIDFPAILAFLHAIGLPARIARPPRFVGFVAVLVVFIVSGELAAIVYFGEVLEPIYALGRMLIAVSIFYSAAQLIRTPKDLEPILKAAVIGLVVTAAMMIMSSLPPTRGVARTVFSNPFLEPAAASVVEQYSLETREGIRGRSLIGVSIMSGVFINVMLPLALMLFRWPHIASHWRVAAMASVALAPMGVLVSWSRGAILGLLMVTGAIVAFGARKLRGLVLTGLALTAAVILWIGTESELFMFDRLENRTIAAVTNPYDDVRESERILAYVEPFEHLAGNPQFLLVGEGSISDRLSWQAAISGKANHAIFAKGYYAYGFVAALMYTWMPIMMILYLARIRQRIREDRFLKDYTTAVLVAAIALVPWFAFGHAAISEARGAMLAFLVLGMVASVRNFLPRPRIARRPDHAFGAPVAPPERVVS